jgi:hypothetical protein
MNVLEGLNAIRDRLDENGASPATIALVDQMRKRAAVPAAQAASAQSLLQLVRMLMRTPVADANVTVYNDLVRLEDQLQVRAADYQDRRAAEAAEEAKPLPKLKKYYKEQKEKAKKVQG